MWEIYLPIFAVYTLHIQRSSRMGRTGNLVKPYAVAATQLFWAPHSKRPAGRKKSPHPSQVIDANNQDIFLLGAPRSSFNVKGTNIEP